MPTARPPVPPKSKKRVSFSFTHSSLNNSKPKNKPNNKPNNNKLKKKPKNNNKGVSGLRYV